VAYRQEPGKDINDVVIGRELVRQLVNGKYEADILEDMS
jgi:hypothetical protein